MKSVNVFSDNILPWDNCSKENIAYQLRKMFWRGSLGNHMGLSFYKKVLGFYYNCKIVAEKGYYSSGTSDVKIAINLFEFMSNTN